MIYLILIVLLGHSLLAMEEMKVLVMKLPEDATECLETTPLCAYGPAVQELEGQLATESNTFAEFMNKSVHASRNKTYFEQRVRNQIDIRRNLEGTFFINDVRKWHLLEETIKDIEKRAGINPNTPLISFFKDRESIRPFSNTKTITLIKQNHILKQKIIHAFEIERIYLDYYGKLEEKKDTFYNRCVNCGGQLLGYGGATGSFASCVYSSSSYAPASGLCCAATSLFSVAAGLCCALGLYCSFRCCCPEQLSSEKCCVPLCLQVETNPEVTHMRLAQISIQRLLNLMKNN